MRALTWTQPVLGLHL